MTEFTNVPLFLSLWLLIGISLRYHKSIRDRLFFNANKRSVFTIIIGSIIVILALIGFFISVLWLAYGFSWMFYHPDWFSYFKWHYVYMFFYFSFMYVQREISNLIVRSYNKAVRKIVYDALDVGYDFYSPSETHSELRDFCKGSKGKAFEKHGDEWCSCFESIMQEHILSENKLYSRPKELDDDKFLHKNLKINNGK